MRTATTLTAPVHRYGIVNWLTCIVMVVFHVGAVAALFHFSWTLLAIAFVLYWMARRLRHRHGLSPAAHAPLLQDVPKWLEYFFAVCGTLTLEGGPIFWVATHRIHHQHSDTDGDPHTPRDGGFWAHMGWILFGEAHHNDTERAWRKYAPDLAADPFYRWLQHVSLGAAHRHRRLSPCSPSAAGPLVFWAVFLRVVVGLHATWLVNSATHMWGSRRFDDARTTRRTAGGWRS